MIAQTPKRFLLILLMVLTVIKILCDILVMTISFYDEVEMWPDIEDYPIMDLQNNPNNLTIDIWYGTVEGLINNKDKR